MISRPTIALCMIVKNEAHNLPRLFESIKGCFDEVHITDTGSTDNTVEIAKSYGATVHHFTWVNDFSKARNYSFSKATADYIMWMDGDDVLSDKDKFIEWRDNVMLLADFWLATYWYAFDDAGNPMCTFARERVVRRTKAIKWKYFIHEGMIPEFGESIKAQYTKTWHINHMRTKDDFENDRGRNISLLGEAYEADAIPPRLMFYYGKELYDTGNVEKSVKVFDELSQSLGKLEYHDKLLTFEYWVRALMSLHYKKEAEQKITDNALLEKAFALVGQGITLMPNRAEFHVLAGDCLLKMGRLKEALPYYSGASVCIRPGPLDPSPIFYNQHCYEQLPLDQMSRIYANLGDIMTAIGISEMSVGKYKHPDSMELLNHLIAMKPKEPNKNKVKTDEIVISCFEQTCPYEWNDEIYKVKGIGGSETAAVEVAEWLAKKTDKKVIVFNRQTGDRLSPNGVLYTSSSQMAKYFDENEPALHIAWRHNIKLTDAPTYLWCHDLMTAGAENDHYDKIICLTPFHKHYVKIMQNLKEEKIVVSKNGLNMKRFDGLDFTKKKANKIIFPSSPDRGLIRAIDIVRRARAARPELDLELHVYYGFENTRKYGLASLADKLEKEIAENSWIKYHGNVPQDVLAREMSEAAVWLYPADFIETFCITAIEALSAKCYPLVREIGALRDTLRWAHENGMAKLILMDAETSEEKDAWAKELISVIDEKRWEKIDTSSQDYTWESVADHFIEFTGVNRLPQIPELPYTEVADAILPEVAETVREYGEASV